jgi:hypothetical protein
LIDDGHLRRAGGVAGIEQTPFEQWNAQGLVIIGRNRLHEIDILDRAGGHRSEPFDPDRLVAS